MEDILFKDTKHNPLPDNPLIKFAERIGFQNPSSITDITKKGFDQHLNTKPEEQKSEQVHVRLPKEFAQIERYLEERLGIYSKNKIYGTAIEHGLCLYMEKNFEALRNIYHLRNRLILSDNFLANQLYDLRMDTPLKGFFTGFAPTPSTIRMQPNFKFLMARLTDETHISQSDICRNAIVYSLFTSEKASGLRTKFNKIIKEDLQFIQDYTSFLENNASFFTGKTIDEIKKEIYAIRVRKK